MPRLKKSPETADLMSWAEIAERVELSPTQVRRIYAKALTKLRIALEAEGVTREMFLRWLHDKDTEPAATQEQLAARLSVKENLR